MSNTPAEQLVWIDCEMTGLDVENDGLVEIGVIVTDFDLVPLDPGFQLVINPGPQALALMNDFVRNMHETSGLSELIEDGATLEEAEAQVIAYIDRFVPAGRRPLHGHGLCVEHSHPWKSGVHSGTGGHQRPDHPGGLRADCEIPSGRFPGFRSL